MLSGSGALGVGAKSGGLDQEKKGTTVAESKGKSDVNQSRSRREHGLKKDDDPYPSFDFKRELLSEHTASRSSVEHEPIFYDLQTGNSSQELHTTVIPQNTTVIFPNTYSNKQRPFNEIIESASNETSQSQLNTANLKSEKEKNELNPVYYNKTSFTDLNKDDKLKQLSSQNSSNKMDIQLFNNPSPVPAIPYETVEGINPQNDSSCSISSNNNSISALKISYRFFDTVHESNKERILNDYSVPINDKRSKIEMAPSIVFTPDDLKNANHSLRIETEVTQSNVHSTDDLKNANYSLWNETDMVTSNVYSTDDIKNANHSLWNEADIAPSNVYSTDDIKNAKHSLWNEADIAPSNVYSTDDLKNANYSLRNETDMLTSNVYSTYDIKNANHSLWNEADIAPSNVYSTDDIKNANHSLWNEADIAPSNVYSTDDLKNANYSLRNETDMVPSNVYSTDDLKNANHSLRNETEVAAPSTVHSTDDLKKANHSLWNETEVAAPSNVHSTDDLKKANNSLPCLASPTACSEDLLSSCFPLMKNAFITYCANDTTEDAKNMRNEILHDELNTPLKTCVKEIFNNCSEVTFRCILGLLDIFPNNTKTTNKNMTSCKFSVFSKLLIEKINIKPLKLVPSS
ncbi:uncharacterized protein LOC118184667 [Stegodyphus dumicola]|uniref:uncharacterized protein LOC118184667 n=1 Tax=Stegodyphus dumicola TaxID=202533 RepID=UPI0015ADB9B4|nr:uncharacterized protein LOC118184667 [Stegodyphus dumicola]